MGITHFYSPEKILAKKIHKEHQKMQRPDGEGGHTHQGHSHGWERSHDADTEEERYHFTFILEGTWLLGIWCDVHSLRKSLSVRKLIEKKRE